MIDVRDVCGGGGNIDVGGGGGGGGDLDARDRDRDLELDARDLVEPRTLGDIIKYILFIYFIIIRVLWLIDFLFLCL